MKVTKCKECGNEINNKMKECPKCGHPIKRKVKLQTVIFVIIIILIVILFSKLFLKKLIENKSNNIKNIYGNETYNLTSYTDNFIQYGDWMIFGNGVSEILNRKVSNFEEGIYKYNTSTGQVIKLSDYDGFSYNIINNMLFYVSKFNEINYINLDSLNSDRLAWIDGNNYKADDLFTCDGYLYYRESNGKNIYRTDTAGETKRLVAEYTEGNYQIYDNHIYYIDVNSHNLYRKILEDGATKESLINETISEFYYKDNKIIYKVAETVKIKDLTDMSTVVLKDGVTSNFVVNENLIYMYTSENKSIISINIEDRTEETVLDNIEKQIYRLQLFDNKLYYSHRKSDGLWSYNVTTTLYCVDINNKTQKELQYKNGRMY